MARYDLTPQTQRPPVSSLPADFGDRSPKLARKLLWVDCSAGAFVGVAVLLLSGWLSRLFGLPQELLLFTGAVNVLYASYSFSLAARARRPRRLIGLLVFANLAWACVCVALAVAFWASASVLGIAHLLAEAVFVGGLGAWEWRWRDALLTAD